MVCGRILLIHVRKLTYADDFERAIHIEVGPYGPTERHLTQQPLRGRSQQEEYEN